MLSTGNLLKNRILIIGSNGMLGQRLVEFYLKDASTEIFCASVEDESFFKNVEYRKTDITNKSEIKSLIRAFYPDVIVNAAAYTNVDKCESEKDLAYKINAFAVESLAKLAFAYNAHLIHISTDYVFDGTSGPYTETDKVNPISYYGRTKLAGENAVIASNVKYTIIRTNVLYGPAKYGRMDFVKWVVSSLRQGKQISIVSDQINNPTYIDDLVSGINSVAIHAREGIYNIGGYELLSRYSFTLRIADYFHLDKSLINPIETISLNQPAKRPLKSGLVNLKAETEIEYKPYELEATFRLMQEELTL
jgi:dTDP-4-dehydrorhamnose reductase